jgi:hypothetical protein
MDWPLVMVDEGLGDCVGAQPHPRENRNVETHPLNSHSMCLDQVWDLKKKTENLGELLQARILCPHSISSRQPASVEKFDRSCISNAQLLCRFPFHITNRHYAIAGRVCWEEQ